MHCIDCGHFLFFVALLRHLLRRFHSILINKILKTIVTLLRVSLALVSLLIYLRRRGRKVNYQVCSLPWGARYGGYQMRRLTTIISNQSVWSDRNHITSTGHTFFIYSSWNFMMILSYKNMILFFLLPLDSEIISSPLYDMVTVPPPLFSSSSPPLSLSLSLSLSLLHSV